MTDDTDEKMDALLEALEAEDNPEGYLADLAEEVEAMTEDETIQFASTSRQDAGWMKFYIECPECETPMARTTVESEGRYNEETELRESSAEIRAVCPDCREMMSAIEISRKTGSIDAVRG